MEEIFTYLRSNYIQYEEDVDLKKRTWIHRGGIAKLWITPITCNQLQQLCLYLYKHNLKFKLIGQTSNTYFTNNYNPGIIVSTTKLSNYKINKDFIECDCGVSVKALAKEAVEKGFIGFEGLIDLPGTIGAAIYNNSGCYECLVSSLLNHIEFLNPNGTITKLTYTDLGYSERSSILKRKEREGTILRVVLNIKRTTEIAQLQLTAQNNNSHRITYQERPAQNLGSIFPNRVMTSFYKSMPFKTKVMMKISHIPLRILMWMGAHTYIHTYIHYWDRNIICLSNGMWRIRNYISPKSFNCFIWKDENADAAFEQYRTFVLKIAKANETEIEIIK